MTSATDEPGHPAPASSTPAVSGPAVSDPTVSGSSVSAPVASTPVVEGSLVRPRRYRTHDQWHVVIAVLLVAVAIVIRAVGRTTWDLAVDDLAELLARLPDGVLTAVRTAFAALVVVVVALCVLAVLVRRRLVAVGVALLAALVAGGLTALALQLGWIVSDLALQETPAGTALQPVAAAATAAALGVLRPWLPARWRWVCTALLMVSVPAFLIAGGSALSSLLCALAFGNLVAALAQLAWRSPSSVLPVAAVLRDLSERGLVVRSLRVDPPDAAPFVAHVVLEDGTRLGLQVLSEDDRASEAARRLRRLLTQRRPGDALPFSSLRRAVEHEALVTLAAERAGVRTVGELLVGQPASGWMMLGVREPVGTSLARGFPAGTPDAVRAAALDDLWEDLDAMRHARLTHGGIRPDVLSLRDAATARAAGDDADPADAPPTAVPDAGDGAGLVMREFRAGQVAASDQQLGVDLAQALYTGALLTDAATAVSSARARLGDSAVVAAATYLGVSVVPRTRRADRRARRGAVDAVRAEVESQCGVAGLETVQLSRFNGRALLQLVLLAGLTYVVLPLVAEIPATVEAVRTADPVWMVVAAAIAVLGPPAAALSLTSCTTARLPFLRSCEVQVATSFVGTSTPASVGSLALQVRYLTKTGGLPAAAATGAVALQSVVQLGTHLALLVLLGVVGGRSLDLSHLVPGREVVVLVVAVVLTVVGIVLLVPRLRRLVSSQLRARLGEVGSELGELARRPTRLLLAVLGSMGVIACSALALWACVLAFGGGNRFVAAAFVTMVGATLATAAPTPGGVGAVEAAVIAGLVAFGVPSAIAVPATFLYRLLTTWVPVAAGWFMLRRLQRVGAV